MFTIWTSHLKTKDEKLAFEKLLKNTDKRVLDAIERILLSNLQLMDKREDLDSYDSPSWAYRQAHINGYREGISKGLELIQDLKG